MRTILPALVGITHRRAFGFKVKLMVSLYKQLYNPNPIERRMS